MNDINDLDSLALENPLFLLLKILLLPFVIGLIIYEFFKGGEVDGISKKEI